ncbi:MAG: hypothetical protein ACTSSE_17955, partial [Candidatus Thorarchaeota archaeon]
GVHLAQHDSGPTGVWWAYSAFDTTTAYRSGIQSCRVGARARPGCSYFLASGIRVISESF